MIITAVSLFLTSCMPACTIIIKLFAKHQRFVGLFLFSTSFFHFRSEKLVVKMKKERTPSTLMMTGSQKPSNASLQHFSRPLRPFKKHWLISKCKIILNETKSGRKLFYTERLIRSQLGKGGLPPPP